MGEKGRFWCKIPRVHSLFRWHLYHTPSLSAVSEVDRGQVGLCEQHYLYSTCTPSVEAL